jgi:NTE family protein
MTNIKYLSFEGGGVKGLAFIGVLKYFEDKNITLENLISVSGSSIGAIMALCVSLRFTSSELKSLFDKYNLYNFFSFSKVLYSLPNLFYNYGLLSTDELNKIVTDILTIKNIPVDINFKDFVNLTNINLIITISDMNNSKSIFCNHINTPSKEVKSCIVTSASFPIIFVPTTTKNEDNTFQYYVDGGLFANIPFKYFDEIYDNFDTQLYAYGFIFEDIPLKINNFFDYIEALIEGLVSNSTDMYYKNNDKIDPRIVSIKLPNDIATFSVLNEEQKQKLIDCGYNSSKTYFDKNL